VGVDGVHGAEGIDEGRAGVHGHGYTEGFGDFFPGGAGFKGGVGVKGDAAVAVRGDGTAMEMSWRTFSPRWELTLLASERLGSP